MSQEPAISVANVSKAYRIWESPADRLFSPIQSGLAGLLPANSPAAQGLQKRAARNYRDFYALRDVTFEVKKGESVGIIGRNGSGKSTLLQIIAGTLQPTTGSVKVNGRVAALLELGSGFNPEFSGRENVYLNGAVLGLTRQQVDERFDYISAFADIGDFIDQPVKIYSSGMALRLAFAVQTIVDPEVLIVDEALAVGDEAFQRKCVSRIEHLKTLGTAILFVSHSAQSIIQLCEQAVMLDGGRQIFSSAPKDVVHFYQKYLYAAPALQHAMREDPSAHILGSSPPATTQAEASSDDAYEFFSETLKSESHVTYGANGASITDCVLLNLKGVPVNHLRIGRQYQFCYNVKFDQDFRDVAFGMMITTINGVEVGGSSTWGHRDKLRSFRAGQMVRACFRFTCLLQPGLYFIKCGIANEETGFIHRHVDVLNFRTSSPFQRLQTGLADLGMTMTVGSADGADIALKAGDL
jgi:lipopolysaccharide transport system ATP-binding protein